MKSSVVLFPDVHSSIIGDLSTLCPADVKIPEGFKLTGGNRKFIVLRNDEELVLAIGPLMAGNSYYHKEILAASRLNYGHLKISGGGAIDFTARLEKGEVKWSTKFSGSSGDYGVFDPEVLVDSVRDVVKESLGMLVSFEWSW